LVLCLAPTTCLVLAGPFLQVLLCSSARESQQCGQPAGQPDFVDPRSHNSPLSIKPLTAVRLPGGAFPLLVHEIWSFAQDCAAGLRRKKCLRRSSNSRNEIGDRPLPIESSAQARPQGREGRIPSQATTERPIRLRNRNVCLNHQGVNEQIEDVD
jgi:hypothetical protein